MNGVQTRFKCKLDVKRCKRFVFPPSSLLPRSNALKTKAIRYFQTDRTLTRIVSPPLQAFCATDQQLDLYIAPTNGSVNYQQIIESFCLPDSVRVHYTDGVIPYLLAQKVARKSCVVICCMDFPYTVGLTTLVEAFALGIPVICSRNPNFEMDIDKEEIGITVAYDDVEGWINAIHRIADHPEEAQKMGANARKLAEKRFNLEIFSREIAESLLEISKMSPKKRTFA